jgi:hypothetical protein
MNKHFFLVMLSSVVLILSYELIFSNRSAAPNGFTGAPGEQTCATIGCHAGNPITQGNRIVLQTTPPGQLSGGYTPGQVYNLTLNLNSIGAPRYGFSLVALNQQNQSVGSFEVVGNNQNFMQVIPGANNRTYVTHKNAASNAAVPFRFTAPNSDEVITFYVAANGANANGAASGDMIYLSNFTLTRTSFTDNVSSARSAADQRLLQSLSIYPNPATDFVMLKSDFSEAKSLELSLFDLQGREIADLGNAFAVPGTSSRKVELPNQLTPGIYLLRVAAEDGQAMLRLSVQ